MVFDISLIKFNYDVSSSLLLTSYLTYVSNKQTNKQTRKHNGNMGYLL